MVTYRDGTPIPEVTDNAEWANLTTGAWCYYNNDETKPRLYNWYAVMGIHDPASLSNPSLRKEFAPEGWHVPTDGEWTTLEEHLIANGYNYDDTITENKIAKAMASTTGWSSTPFTGTIGNDQSSNNSSGFNAFPEGFRYRYGSFNIEGLNAIFWSSTENDTGLAWNRSLSSYYSDLYRLFVGFKLFGLSVRFVRDASTASTENNQSNTITIYPNPTISELVLEAEQISFTKQDNIKVFSILGKELYSSSINSQKTIIDLSKYSHGTYILVTTIDGIQKTFKINDYALNLISAIVHNAHFLQYSLSQLS